MSAVRQRTLIGGGHHVLDYLKRMQAENPALFYALQVDNTHTGGNIFWADAAARMNYNHFGDTVIFDTTYRTSNFKVPFASFTGVNHHGQPVLLGCAMIFNESESSFAWVLQSWLHAMSGRQPASITIDPDGLIQMAVNQVLPQTRLRFNKWAIFRETKEKLAPFYQSHPNFEMEFRKCISETETIDEFESFWASLLERYFLMDNEWLQSMYNARQLWVPVYMRDTFFGELSAKEDGEGLNSYFEGYVNVSTTIQMLIKQYERAQASWHEKELKADDDTTNTMPVLRTPSPMEKQAANLYTRRIFMKFQQELVETLANPATKIEDTGSVTTFRVAKFGEDHKAHTVAFNSFEMKAGCSCQMFEYSGLVCRHILAVFRAKNVLTLPSHYVLKRWTRDAKSGSISEEPSTEMPNDQESSMTRYNNLRQETLKYVEEGAKSIHSYHVAMDALHEAMRRLMSSKNQGSRVIEDGTLSSGVSQESDATKEAETVTSHVAEEKQKKINEVAAELESANRRCEVYRANLLSVLRDMEEQKLKLSLKVQNAKLSLKDGPFLVTETPALQLVVTSSRPSVDASITSLLLLLLLLHTTTNSDEADAHRAATSGVAPLNAPQNRNGKLTKTNNPVRVFVIHEQQQPAGSECQMLVEIEPVQERAETETGEKAEDAMEVEDETLESEENRGLESNQSLEGTEIKTEVVEKEEPIKLVQEKDETKSTDRTEEEPLVAENKCLIYEGDEGLVSKSHKDQPLAETQQKMGDEKEDHNDEYNSTIQLQTNNVLSGSPKSDTLTKEPNPEYEDEEVQGEEKLMYLSPPRVVKEKMLGPELGSRIPNSTSFDHSGSETEDDHVAFAKEVEAFYRERNLEFKHPKFYKEDLNLLKLWKAVIKLGGYEQVTSCKLWRQVGESFNPPKTCTTVSWTFRIFYEKALLEYEKHRMHGGELTFPESSLIVHNGIGGQVRPSQALGSGRARRDAAARAMQGWHSQRVLDNGEVCHPIIKDKDKSSHSAPKCDRQSKNFGLLKRKKPPTFEHVAQVGSLRAAKPQLDTMVVDIGPPAEWVKINVEKTTDCFEIYALVPGLMREEVRVQSDPAGRLVISGQPTELDNPWGVTPFKKVVSLPCRIDTQHASAVVTLHGQLFMRVPFEQPDL